MKDHEFAHALAAVCAYLGLGVSALVLFVGVTSTGVTANNFLMQGGNAQAAAAALATTTEPIPAVSVNPQTVMPGQSATVTWSTGNPGATNWCSMAGGIWSAGSTTPLAGSQSTGALTQSTTYSFYCYDQNNVWVGPATATVTVATSTTEPAPTISVNPQTILSGQSAILTWSVGNPNSAQVCSLNGGIFGQGTGVATSSGAHITDSLTQSTTYQLWCYDQNNNWIGPVSATVTVASSTPPPAPPVCPVSTLQNGATAADLESMLNNGCTTITTAPNAQVSINSGNAITIPYGVTLVFNTGSAWTIGAGTTVFLQGNYQIPLQRTQFFYGPGQIISADSYDSLGCPLTQTVAYPEWFGAQVNDGIDDSGAILQALALGNQVVLATGTYDVANRIPLLGHQSIVGQGVGITNIDQVSNPNLIQYAPTLTSPGYQDWVNIKLQDFIVSLTSDCASISNLSILGDRVPTDTSALSNVKADLGSPAGISGIQLSSSYGWSPGEPPVKNISVKNVSVYKPVNDCLNIQSDRGVQNVNITGVTCVERDGGNTSALTIEAYNVVGSANDYENVSISSSTFSGGNVGLYIAGVKNLSINHTTVSVNQGDYTAMLYYTGDVGMQTTGNITNSTFSFMSPDSTADSVIKIAGRGYVKDTAGTFPYLQDEGSTLAMNNDTISSAQYATSTILIPLIHDSIGLDQPLKITNSTFNGGSWGILGADPTNPNAFGSEVFIQNPNGAATTVRDITPAELSTYKVAHSDLDIENSQFTKQAFSSIQVIDDALKIIGNTFNDIGTSPQAFNYPIISLATTSPFSTLPAPQDSITNNMYSGVYDNALALAPNVSGLLSYSGNAPFVYDAQSIPLISMGGLRFYATTTASTTTSTVVVPTSAINTACPSNDLSQGVCTLSHVLLLTATSSLTATFASWVAPNLSYVVNYGDGTEVSIPDCGSPTSQANSCTTPGTISHAYAKAGTYSVEILNYPCAGSTTCSVLVDSLTVTVTAPPVSSAINTACPSNYLVNGVCSLSHLLGVQGVSGPTVTVSSWVHPGLAYAINYGDGTELQVPTCTAPVTGQPNSCTAAALTSHTYTKAGTYNVEVLNYACAGSTTCSVLVDSASATVSGPPAPSTAVNTACPSNYLSQGICTMNHVMGLSNTLKLTANFYSWVHPGLTYAINFGDGAEVQVPTCTGTVTGQPNACTTLSYISHTYAQAGTYNVDVLNYACAGSTTCSVLVDSASVSVSQ